MVQVFINSSGGAAGYDKMPIALAAGVEQLVGEAWPVFATFIGGIGASVAGSNTVSNMMFSLFQFDVGLRIGVDPTWIVALQAVGGAAGNTICVHNVVAASAVVGLVGKEGVVIRKTLVVFTYYALLTGCSRLRDRVVVRQRTGQPRLRTRGRHRRDGHWRDSLGGRAGTAIDRGGEGVAGRRSPGHSRRKRFGLTSPLAVSRTRLHVIPVDAVE